MEIYLAHTKSRGYFLSIKWSKVLLNVGPMSRIPPHSLEWILNTQNSIYLTIWKIQVHQSTFWTHANSSIFPRTYCRHCKRFLFYYCLPGWHYHLRRTAEEHLNHIKQVFKKLQNAHLWRKLNRCHFFTKEIQHLRHILSTTGIRPLASKTPSHKQHTPTKNC